jgi:uncharacterized protein YndB with AHSA1/START domain
MREDRCMGDSSYTFQTVWHLNASPEDVYRALERVADYPLWWPEVRDVRPLGDQSFELTCKSALPYELRFTTTQSVRDPSARVLEARMAGDLEGFSRWTVRAQATSTSATFDEEVFARKALLRRLDPIARPAFKVNHTRMMRNGERGLRTYLAGYRATFD